jgi:hypothetical protein
MKIIFVILLVLASVVSPLWAEDQRGMDLRPYTETNYGFRLAPELERRLLKNSEGAKIIDIQKIEAYVTDPFTPLAENQGLVLLTVHYSLMGKLGHLHGQGCFARKITDPDWSTAREFDLPLEVEFTDLRRMTPAKLEAFIQQHLMAPR